VELERGATELEFTEEEFSKHLNTKFKVRRDDGSIDLELVEVRPYSIKTNEEKGMSRFSLLFDGPSDAALSQASYQVDHQEMGTFDIFLVPIAASEKGFSYEAVFNVYKA
jgi:hypothetical protein